MPAEKPLDPGRLKALVLRVLDENRTLSIATLRPDGWPQTTIVGFVHDDLTLYFVVSRESQKLANLKRDPRASIAVGQHLADDTGVRGLSMAVQIDEVENAQEIERLNELVSARYPRVKVFAPRRQNSAVLRAEPHLVSLVDEAEGLVLPVLLEVRTRTELSPIPRA